MVSVIGGYGEDFGRDGEANWLKGEEICEPLEIKVRLCVLTVHFDAGTLRSNMRNAA